MNQEFKNKLREVKEILRGQRIRVSLNGQAMDFTTLRGLGNRILELENKGCTFSFYEGDFTRIIASNGVNMMQGIREIGTTV